MFSGEINIPLVPLAAQHQQRDADTTEATKALIFSLDRPLTLRTLLSLPAPVEESLIIFPDKLITEIFFYFILNELVNEFTWGFLHLILQFKSSDNSRKLAY